MTEHKNLVALITGSGRQRIGYHVAKELATQGFRIAVHYHSSEREAIQTVDELSHLGAEAIAFQADLRSTNSADQLINHTLDHFHQIDILLNAASTWTPTPLENITEDQIHDSWSINALGTFNCSRSAGLQMVKQRTGGLIINMADWSLARPQPNYAAYYLAKGTIPTMSRMLAVELGLRNRDVRVNCLSPGPVLSPEGISHVQKERRDSDSLVNGADDPNGVVEAVNYLSNNRFVTGQNLVIDGGRMIYNPAEANL